MDRPTYGDYIYPEGAIVVGWIIAFISLIPIPVLAIHELCTREGPFVEVSGYSSLFSSFPCTFRKILYLTSRGQ